MAADVTRKKSTEYHNTDYSLPETLVVRSSLDLGSILYGAGSGGGGAYFGFGHPSRGIPCFV